MRFNNTKEVRDAAEKAAHLDCEKHKQVHTDADGTKWQVDLNPYTTQGARNCWQRGFEGLPARSFDIDLGWDFQYQRGAAAARIIKGAA